MKDNNSQSKRKISRRDFVSNTAAGTAMLAFAPTNTLLAGTGNDKIFWPAYAPGYKFHMIGHAHIDPVWLWPWTEGLAIVHSTFQSALDRMDETPDFIFTASSAQFYQWVADNDPEMLVKIRQRVIEGRWNIVGGWWVEPDVNIPGGEAMVRQGLYGQLTFERLLGQRAKAGFNPDSFGHAGTLPQILKQQGMDYYVFMRPQPHEKELPSELFYWEGLDGTHVLTYRIPVRYWTAESTKNERRGIPIKKQVSNVLEQMHGQPMKSIMAYYGASDHGGGATKENIKSIKELRQDKDAPEVIFGDVDHYFE